MNSRNPERFIKIPYYIVRTFAWGCLSPADRATWLELAALYNGSNNGSIAASTRVLANRMNIGKSTVARARNGRSCPREHRLQGWLMGRRSNPFCRRSGSLCALEHPVLTKA
jgi:hypothetical protein